MPGPVFTAAVVKGAESKHAGALVALGHLIVEVPLIIIIGLGFAYVFTHNLVELFVGVLGGGFLVYMGASMFIHRRHEEVAKRSVAKNAVVAGMITTATNPYFIIWWATVGALLIERSLTYGALGIVLFVVVHESCDFAWDYLVSYIVNTSKKLWNETVRIWIFGFFGLLLMVFGAYFILAYWL